MPSETLILNGKKYVSLGKAAELAGFTPEYVSKLSRDGFVGGTMIAGASYIDLDSFSGHMQDHGGNHKGVFFGNVDRDHSLRTLRTQERDMSGRTSTRGRDISLSRKSEHIGTRQGAQFQKSPTGSRLGVRPANGGGGTLRSVRRGMMFLLIFAGVAYGWGTLQSQVNTGEVLSTMETSVGELAKAVSEWELPHTFLSKETTSAQQAAVVESRNVFSCSLCEKVEELFR